MYTNLKTRPIKVSPNKCPNMKQKITSTLNECFKTKAFSTFPYIMDDALSSITPSLHTLDAPLILNEYQRFPKNTHYCQCYFDEHNDDPWNYYLREITNPDEAITSTFISVRPNPFFTSTKLDDGQWKKDLIITTHNNNTISIKNNNSSIYNGDRFTIPDTIKALVESMLVERGFDKNILV
jgi:hypothetical protein